MLRCTPVIRTSCLLALAFLASSAFAKSDYYAILLHSHSVADQRVALRIILNDSEKYIPRIQQSLRAYPDLLQDDPTAAKRAVYLSALIHDASFPPTLVKTLDLPAVLDQCIYACPVVFALTISASFWGWEIPRDLDPTLTTVVDLKGGIANISRISLRVGSIEDVVQGPDLEKYRKELESKTEKQLIQLAGPDTLSPEARTFAAYRLETLVTESKNRIDLYLLAMNDLRDSSGEYLDAIYQSIYRAEVARAQGK